MPSGEQRRGQRGGHLDLWQETLPGPKLVRLEPGLPEALFSALTPASWEPQALYGPAPAKHQARGGLQRERERDLVKQVPFLLLFLCYLVLEKVCTLWLWILFHVEVVSFAA